MMIYLIGILIGIAIAAPMGPVGILCIRKTLEFGLVGTLAVGLGTALVDALYAGIAAYGLSTVSEFVLKHFVYFKVLGGVLLFGLALKEYFSKSIIMEHVAVTKEGVIGLFSSAFFITLLNPIGIASFLGLFAMLGNTLLSMNNAAFIVMGVFTGSLSWFLILGKIISRTQHLLPEKLIHSLRKISAFIFAAFGTWAIISLAFN